MALNGLLMCRYETTHTYPLLVDTCPVPTVGRPIINIFAVKSMQVKANSGMARATYFRPSQ